MKGAQYSQKLSPRKAAEGMAAATENAISLLSDAHLLFDNERYERSVALAILAIEEAGKVSILRQILVQDDPKELNRSWKDYRSHTSKNVQWQLPALVAEGARQLEEFRGLFDRNSSHGAQLDRLKQAAFYTDAVGPCDWITPKQAITKELAEAIMLIAKVLVRTDKSMCTEPALELWLKHMKPVQGRDMLTMKQALINCYQEAEDLGILPKGKTKDMIGFVL
ncbi:MAG: AbiV family abortive infection protein [Flavobacteriales bacterium]|nr:AbiV family abortive infection protein [Flavobacteriales bacterium]